MASMAALSARVSPPDQGCFRRWQGLVGDVIEILRPLARPSRRPPAAVRARPIEIGVADDRQQPGLGVAALIAGEPAIGLEHGVLGDVLGRAGVAAKIPCQGVGDVQMRQNEAAEPRRL
jgi:hypothetical protein